MGCQHTGEEWENKNSFSMTQVSGTTYLTLTQNSISQNDIKSCKPGLFFRGFCHKYCRKGPSCLSYIQISHYLSLIHLSTSTKLGKPPFIILVAVCFVWQFDNKLLSQLIYLWIRLGIILYLLYKNTQISSDICYQFLQSSIRR